MKRSVVRGRVVVRDSVVVRNRVAQTLAVACLAVCGVAPAFGQAAPASTRPARAFAHPDRIRYDGRCLTIEGKDTFVYSGAFHYFRVPKELWRARFAAIKAAGFNCVETYACWNWHERERPAGLGDASKIDLTDLKDWLHMAHEEFGLYTIVRPGPYICAEWNGGGFPQWLWSEQPADRVGKPWVRTDDPQFLAWSKHWLDAVTPVIAAEQITRKPPGAKGTILFQIENEYDYNPTPPDAKRRHLRYLYENARANGIDVPIFTCWTREVRNGRDDAELSQVFDASNFYNRWDMAGTARQMRDLVNAQPDAPPMIAELQGGWFAEAGGSLSEDQDGVDAAQCNAITFTSMANGGTILSYYMLVGSSNFGTWGGGNILQTYDYNAPLREAGGKTEKYAAVSAIGAFLARHGPAVARSALVQSTVSGEAKVDVVVRANADGERFVFVRNPQTTAQDDATFDVRLADGTTLSIANAKLPPRQVRVLALPAGKTNSADGTWWGEPAALPARPTALPAAVRVADALTRDEPGPTNWRPIAPDASLIQAGVYDIGDVVYRVRPTLTAEQLARYNTLRVDTDEAARLALRVNDKIVRATRAGKRVDFALDGILRAGENAIELLYENHGIPGFGDALNAMPGVRGLSLVPAGARGRPLDQWRVALVETRATARNQPPRPEVATDFDDATWASFVLDEKTLAEVAMSKQPGHPPLTYPAAAILNDQRDATAVYRTTIDLSDAELAARPLRVEFDGFDDDGEVFVNGRSVGRVRGAPYAFEADVTDALHAGRNVIAAVVHNRDGDGGLTKLASLVGKVDALPLDEGRELGTAWRGEAEQWWQPTTDVGGWQKVALDATRPLALKGKPSGEAAPAKTLVKWTRAEFELPAPTADAWVPWAATIDASGDGQVYLNGHALGRYYDVGPQRRFYLPEPWLHVGPGAKNVLALSLHAVRGEPALNALEVAPIAEQAERR